MDNQCGKIIRLLREHRELTQIELAKQLSVSRELVSKWEQGKSYPNQEIIEKLGAVFNIDSKYLTETDEYIINRFADCIPIGVAATDASKLVFSYIDLMGAEESELFAMRYVECLSSKQIAEQMHLSDGTIRNKLVHLRKKLKEFIAATRIKK